MTGARASDLVELLCGIHFVPVCRPAEQPGAPTRRDGLTVTDNAEARQERVKMPCAGRWLEGELSSKILLRLDEEFLVVGNVTADMGKWKRDQRSTEILAAMIKENRKITQISTEQEHGRIFCWEGSCPENQVCTDLKRGAG